MDQRLPGNGSDRSEFFCRATYAIWADDGTRLLPLAFERADADRGSRRSQREKIRK
jgi:hypothetical protein